MERLKLWGNINISRHFCPSKRAAHYKWNNKTSKRKKIENCLRRKSPDCKLNVCRDNGCLKNVLIAFGSGGMKSLSDVNLALTSIFFFLASLFTSSLISGGDSWLVRLQCKPLVFSKKLTAGHDIGFDPKETHVRLMHKSAAAKLISLRRRGIDTKNIYIVLIVDQSTAWYNIIIIVIILYRPTAVPFRKPYKYVV